MNYQDFFENGALPLHIVGPDGHILDVNQAELDLLGYSKEEVVGQRIDEFHADPEVIADILARLKRGETIIGYPATLRAKDGSLKHVQITSSGLFQDGRLVSTRCFTADVTDIVSVQKAHERAEQNWRAAIDGLPAAIYTADAGGRITYYNEAAVAMSGRRPVIGEDSWCVTWKLYDLNGVPLPHDQCPMAVALKDDRPIRGIEAIAERPDGTRIRFLPFPTPLHDEKGKLVGAVNLLIDVTEQRKDEDAAARLAAIVVSSVDAVISKTLDGVITTWNEAAEKMYGYAASEIVGKSITLLVPPELRDEEQNILERLRRGERIEHYETVRIAKNGRRLHVSLSISPIRDKAGKLIGAAKVARDITERKKAEETQKLLVNELSHRVKNTLAVIQSIATQTLRISPKPDEFVPAFTGRVKALAQAHTLLTASNWKGASLGDLVMSQVFADSNDRIISSGPEIMLPPQLALHLALILHELGTNACKYGALSVAEGEVTVAWSVSSRPPFGLHIIWSERGGPAVRIDRSSKRGFGTSLIERSVKSIEGGDANMRVEADGVVWTIRMSLQGGPLAMIVSGAESQRQMVEGEVVAPPEGKRLLLVEDEPLVAMDMAASLQEAGYSVEVASLIDDAVHLAAVRRIDGALLDANLDGVPVDEVASILTRRNIPFGFVSGYGRRGLPAAFASAPAITKPASAHELKKLVQRILGGHSGAIPIRKEGQS